MLHSMPLKLKCCCDTSTKSPLLMLPLLFYQTMAEPRTSSIDGKLAEEFAVPAHVEEVREKMAAFACRHAEAGRRVVLITSGGTKVPLESRTVRFLDNFSSGRRGASSAEYFIDSGYAVIFLHRHRSLYPYTRMFLTINMLDALQFRGGEGAGEVVVNQQVLPGIAGVLKRYNQVKDGGLLLPIEFNTLSEYLHLLKAAAQALSAIGSKAMFYLAAAVSDFYIPASEMPEHKIQSSNGPLQLSMKMVPKLLSPLVKDWAPQAFVTSFKLETDSAILLDRARQALAAYRHQAVVANVLDSRRGYVVVVTPDTQAELVLTEDEAEKDVEIEERIVSNLTSAHSKFISQQAGSLSISVPSSSSDSESSRAITSSWEAVRRV
uniref:Phosphopantothenate--cysteine ligase n=2 Tax=Fundulus heteroclitus TaxID=8078 RepID=A0A3Q2PUM5_FUNHE